MKTAWLFKDDQGRPVVISDGIAQGGPLYAFRIKPSGSLSRIRSIEASRPGDLEGAFVKLCAYAEARGWKAVVS
jgi:hypothetical protein